MKKLQWKSSLVAMALAVAYVTPVWAEEEASDAVLEMPTLELRIVAQEEFADDNRMSGLKLLLEAAELAREQEDLYVQSNELRYIADMFAKYDAAPQAKKHFAEAMDVAVKIPSWNHRLYACIGILEVQRATGDIEGVHDNGMKAIDSGLLEAVAETGEAAETGRFFTAMDGTMTSMERDKLRQKIRGIGGDEFQRKALHALNSIKVKRY